MNSGPLAVLWATVQIGSFGAAPGPGIIADGVSGGRGNVQVLLKQWPGYLRTTLSPSCVPLQVWRILIGARCGPWRAAGHAEKGAVG
jgi:hypothetical protein